MMPMSKGSFAPIAPFRRWTPNDLASGTVPQQGHASDEAVVLPTAGEIEAMHEQAHREGYEAGHAEGLARGLAASRTLLDFADAFQHEITRLDETVAAEVAALALAVAQRGVAYAADPGLVATMVEQALQALPPNLEAARVLVHPEDLAVVAQHIGEEFTGRRITLAADRMVSRGGCRVMTATTDIDSSLETRWARITGALGSLPWIPLDTLNAGRPGAVAFDPRGARTHEGSLQRGEDTPAAADGDQE
jgi:flagellar assembly protein FliH